MQNKKDSEIKSFINDDLESFSHDESEDEDFEKSYE